MKKYPKIQDFSSPQLSVESKDSNKAFKYSRGSSPLNSQKSNLKINCNNEQEINNLNIFDAQFSEEQKGNEMEEVTRYYAKKNKIFSSVNSVNEYDEMNKICVVSINNNNKNDNKLNNSCKDKNSNNNSENGNDNKEQNQKIKNSFINKTKNWVSGFWNGIAFWKEELVDGLDAHGNHVKRPKKKLPLKKHPSMGDADIQKANNIANRDTIDYANQVISYGAMFQ